MTSQTSNTPKRVIPFLLSIAILVTGAPITEAKTIGPTGAAIVGGVAGLAVGAAIADSYHHRKKKIYYQAYAPPYAPGAYGPYFDTVLMPSPGVTCYPAQRVCYHNGGGISGKWTYRIYGY